MSATCRRCGTPLTPVYPGQNEHPLCSPAPKGWIPATALTDAHSAEWDAPTLTDDAAPATATAGGEPAAPRAFRVLVTGSRTWTDADLIREQIHAATQHPDARDVVIVHGACPNGADAIAAAFCRSETDRFTHHGRALIEEPHPADWTRHGRRAGPERNAAMVAAGADVCLAFIHNDSPGATHTANLAEQAAIPTHRHHHHDAAPAELLASALAAAERGWPVFPVRPGEKRPAFPDHTAARCTGRDPRCAGGHQGWEPRATTDVARIRRGWSTTTYNVGLACGPARLVVVDLDIPKPGEETPPEAWRDEGVRSGADVLAVLAERAGQPRTSLFDTYTVITGRGGRHLYYLAPEGVRLGNTQGELGWLIDTRAHGGYVLAAGSIVDGRPYRIERDRPPAPLPAWLTERLTPAAPPPQVPVAIAPATGRRAAYLTAAINREVERVTSAAEGSRNAALYTAAIALGQLVAGGALPPGEVHAVLEQAAAGHVAARAYTSAEARNTSASGLHAGAKRPRSLAA